MIGIADSSLAAAPDSVPGPQRHSSTPSLSAVRRVRLLRCRRSAGTHAHALAPPRKRSVEADLWGRLHRGSEVPDHGLAQRFWSAAVHSRCCSRDTYGLQPREPSRHSPMANWLLGMPLGMPRRHSLVWAYRAQQMPDLGRASTQSAPLPAQRRWDGSRLGQPARAAAFLRDRSGMPRLLQGHSGSTHWARWARLPGYPNAAQPDAEADIHYDGDNTVSSPRAAKGPVS